jgi:hypothetical protein
VSGDVIAELYAWVTLDDEDGNEGVLAFRNVRGEWMPMIGADQVRIESLRDIAEGFAQASKYPIELRRFTTMTVLEQLAPGTPA